MAAFKWSFMGVLCHSSAMLGQFPWKIEDGSLLFSFRTPRGIWSAFILLFNAICAQTQVLAMVYLIEIFPMQEESMRRAGLAGQAFVAGVGLKLASVQLGMMYLRHI